MVSVSDINPVKKLTPPTVTFLEVKMGILIFILKKRREKVLTYVRDLFDHLKIEGIFLNCIN